MFIPSLSRPSPTGAEQQQAAGPFVCVYVHVCKGQWEDSLGYTGPCNFRILYVSNRNRYIHICMYL